MRLLRSTQITVTITACIILSFLLLLIVGGGSCNAGDCSKHAEVLPTDPEAGNNTVAPTNSSAASAATRKDQYQDKTNTSKKSSAHVSPAPQVNRKAGKGITNSMEVQNSHSKPEVGVLGDYDTYDPSPTLVRPPFKEIPN